MTGTGTHKDHRRSIVVVGKFSRTKYGPFDTEAQAQSFIRTQLGSSSRYYDTECNRCIVAPWKGVTK